MTDLEYDELWQLTEEAAERLISGTGRSGTHYELIALLRSKHGKIITGGARLVHNYQLDSGREMSIMDIDGR